MTLLREIQILLERTYGRTGVNLEQFVLGPYRNQQLSELADPSLQQVADLGRVFLRVHKGRLRMGIYFNPTIITVLEHDNPQRGLTDDNVMPFMVFIEEIDHAVHAALKFREGHHDVLAEAFVRNLEVRAKVDTYLILQRYCIFFHPRQQFTDADQRWLRSCVFDSQNLAYPQPHLRRRYHETNRLARRYVRHLDRLTPRQRTAAIRRFRTLDYDRKQKFVQQLAP